MFPIHPHKNKSLRLGFGLLVLISLIISLVAARDAQAKPTNAVQARRVVEHWLALDGKPLGCTLGHQVTQVKPFKDNSGQPLYFIAYLDLAGFVIVSGDDLVEPVIGFLSQGRYDPSPSNPLGALVSRDVPSRVAQVRQLEELARKEGPEAAPLERFHTARRKWGLLLETAPGGRPGLAMGLTTVPDICVAPLVQSKWSQSAEGTAYCYNYYTPNHYPCGCVATAMAQLMRYWEWPLTGVGTPSFNIKVDDTWYSGELRGGDGAGGAYDWDNMVLDPDGSTTDIERQAIGNLTHDAGFSVNMEYTATGSGANTLDTADALVDTFGYSNSKKGYNAGNNIPGDNLCGMVNPNLAAAYPVLLGIKGGTGTHASHAIICDGYGYNFTTLYHHLNMGWAGSDNAWYNLPNIDASYTTYSSVYKCVYNVYPSDSGEIISGRVVDYDGNPLSGVIVTATITGGGTYTTTTNGRGIYSFARIPSATEYTIKASHALFGSRTQVVLTGTSTNFSVNPGNVWGVDFGPWKWAFKTGDRVSSSPAIDKDGNIYVGSGDGKLYAIHPNGTLKWGYATGGEVLSSPAIGKDGMVYVGSKDKKLYAINPNGTKKWEFLTVGEVQASPLIADDGTIYVNSTLNYGFYAINPNGTKKWVKYDLDPKYQAIAANGTIYCGTYANGLHAYGPDGTKIWLLEEEGLIRTCPAIGSDGTIYAGVNKGMGYLYAFRPDGRKKWAFQTQYLSMKSSPAIGPDGTIYIGSGDKNLYAVDSIGNKKWAFPTGYSIDSSPAVGADGTIYVVSWDGRLYAISPSGNEKWSCMIGYGGASSPIIGTDGTVYVGSYDGHLFAFDTSSRGLARSPWPMFHHDPRHTGNVATPVPAAAPSLSPAINLLLLMSD